MLTNVIKISQKNILLKDGFVTVRFFVILFSIIFRYDDAHCWW